MRTVNPSNFVILKNIILDKSLELSVQLSGMFRNNHNHIGYIHTTGILHCILKE